MNRGDVVFVLLLLLLAASFLMAIAGEPSSAWMWHGVLRALT